MIDAFYAGYDTIRPEDFAFICKLDLDLHRQEEVLPVYTVERIERPAVNRP